MFSTKDLSSSYSNFWFLSRDDQHMKSASSVLFNSPTFAELSIEIRILKVIFSQMYWLHFSIFFNLVKLNHRYILSVILTTKPPITCSMNAVTRVFYETNSVIFYLIILISHRLLHRVFIVWLNKKKTF